MATIYKTQQLSPKQSRQIAQQVRGKMYIFDFGVKWPFN